MKPNDVDLAVRILQAGQARGYDLTDAMNLLGHSFDEAHIASYFAALQHFFPAKPAAQVKSKRLVSKALPKPKPEPVKRQRTGKATKKVGGKTGKTR